MNPLSFKKDKPERLMKGSYTNEHSTNSGLKLLEGS